VKGTLTAKEGDALRIAELLVGHGRSGPLPPAIDVPNPSDALCEAVARSLSAGCFQWLLHSGGGRERVVLRSGRRRSGRLWDAALNEHFDLRFTRASRSFWLALAKDVVPLSHRKRRPATPDMAAVTRADRQLVKAAAPDGFDGVGDLVFFALAHEHAGALQLPSSLEEVLRHEIRRAVPLALLFAPDDDDLDENAARALFRTLIAPGPLRVVECIDAALLESWINRFRTVLQQSEDRDAFLGHMRAFARNLRSWIALLDGAHRADLLRSVARFVAALPVRAVPSNLDLRRHALGLPGTTSMAERDEALQAALAVVDVRLELDRLRERLAEERYGDERYEEAQIFVRMLEDELSPHRPAVDTLARTLSGAVG
jgi:hypothetical protein